MLSGGLFSRYFLDTGVRTTAAWAALSEQDVVDFATAARADLSAFRAAVAPNEAVTEERLIFPILRLLGWDLLPQQQATRRREDVPDALLFADAGGAGTAMTRPVGSERYRLADVVHESKRWDLALDRTTDASGRTPASQALRYLRLAEELSRGRVRWALLSNGRLWRLYAYDVTSQAERFLEADLAALLEPGGEAALRTFLLLFRRAAFLPGPDGRSALQAALAEAQEWQQAVTARLSRAIFEEVFPDLLRTLSAADPDAAPGDAAWPERLRDVTLVLLYRLLFLLYAEDRDLLPVEHDGYRPFAITTLRREVAAAIAGGRALSPSAATWWPRLLRLFSAIAGGSDEMGLPPYNGGLFDARRAPLLGRIALPDAAFARVLDRLSRVPGDGDPVWINYRDLSVQQLGAIYEGLLERGVAVQDGMVAPVLDDALRHGSGAYYTPEVLVQLVMRQALAPLLAERREAFKGALARLAAGGPFPAWASDNLRPSDPAAAFLNLKICDPAMGSGHFLVSLVDWLADETLAAMEEAADLAAAVSYRYPLADRIMQERERIEAAAALHGWPLDPRHLDDRQIVRRLLLKRVVYGVDLNPLAVELAKLSLWLHSFTVGAPLSYLDHHLRSGDSLFGAWIADTQALTSGAGRARRGGLALAGPIQAARSAAQAMEQIEDLADADIAQVRQSAGLFGDIEEATRPLRGFLDCLHARLWLPRPAGRAARAEQEMAVNAWLDGVCGDPVNLANGTPPGGVPVTRRAVDDLLRSLRAVAKQRRFLHWQPAFPGVWRTWQGVEPEGGFDAVIGNPPYVRQERLAAVKPVLKARYAAYDGVADLYIYFFEQALRLLRPGGRFAFTVTNKWLKAGYAAALRGVLAERSWVESVTDFGHARGFFPGTDVFPSVVCARRPLPAADAPEQAAVTVVPRELVQMKALEAQVAELAFPMPRTVFTREPWVLEPPAVRALMEKLRQAGLPLRERVGANALYRGVLTGFNEAFVVDTPTRDALVAADGRSAELMRPFLRGQDVDRWASDWPGLSLIVLRSSANYRWPWSDLMGDAAENCFRETFPAVHERFRPMREQMIAREDQGRFWWELRSCSYYTAFEKPKIIYTDIAWTSQFCIDDSGAIVGNTAYILQTGDTWVAACLNSPLGWWFAWRAAQHGKDEALRYFTSFMEQFPIPKLPDGDVGDVQGRTVVLKDTATLRHRTRGALRDWLRVTWDLPSPPAALLEPFNLTPDQFAQAFRAALPARRRTLSAAAAAAIRAEHAATVAPMAARLAEAARHELALSAIVNRAYGLTPEDEALLWATAPPRMPIPPPHAPVPAP